MKTFVFAGSSGAGVAADVVGEPAQEVDLSTASLTVRHDEASTELASPHKQKIKESLGLGRRFAEAKDLVKEAVKTAIERVLKECPRVFGELLACGVQRSSAVMVLGVPLALGTVGGKEAEGALIRSFAVEPQHNLLGNIPGTMYVEAIGIHNGSPFNYHFSAFPVGKKVDALGNHIESYIALPAHGYAEFGAPGPGDFQIAAIGLGTNRFTDRGVQLQGLQEVYRHPNFTYLNPWGGPHDLTIWRTTTEIPDEMIRPLAPVGSLSQGQIVSFAGHSRLAISGVGRQPDTGDSYGGNGRVDDFVSFNLTAADHRSFFYSVNTSSFPFNAAGETGGSGSWVLDSEGRIVGMAVGVTDPFNSAVLSRFTSFTDLTRDPVGGYRSQIEPFSGIQIVPEPSAFVMVFAFGAGSLFRRRR